ncbi:MAG: GNAT family N-acetyltransferase, partial [Planctomycetota bacterium]
MTDTAGIQAIALIYTGGSLPCLHALAEDDKVLLVKELLLCLIPILPRRFYAHLNLGLESVLTEYYSLRPHGSLLSNVDTSQVMGLSMSHLSEIISFFKKAYPGNFFEPRMLETNQYYGIRESDELISIAGVH